MDIAELKVQDIKSDQYLVCTKSHQHIYRNLSTAEVLDFCHHYENLELNFMGVVCLIENVVFNQRFSFQLILKAMVFMKMLIFAFDIRKLGKLYSTPAQCEHHHHPSGRPNQFQYGQMVVKNGWYVWRQRWPKPGLKNIFKWHCTTLLLAFLRFLNTFTTSQRQQALTESLGRFWAWLKLWFVKPKIQR